MHRRLLPVLAAAAITVAGTGCEDLNLIGARLRQAVVVDSYRGEPYQVTSYANSRRDYGGNDGPYYTFDECAWILGDSRPCGVNRTWQRGDLGSR